MSSPCFEFLFPSVFGKHSWIFKNSIYFNIIDEHFILFLVQYSDYFILRTRKPGFLPHQVPQALAVIHKNSLNYFCLYSHLGSINLFLWFLPLVFGISLILSFSPSVSGLCHRIKDVCEPWSSHQFSSRDRLYRKLAWAKAVSPSIWGFFLAILYLLPVRRKKTVLVIISRVLPMYFLVFNSHITSLPFLWRFSSWWVHRIYLCANSCWLLLLGILFEE